MTVSLRALIARSVTRATRTPAVLRPIDDVLIALGCVLGVEEVVYRAGLAIRECTVQQFGDRVLALDEETSCFASFCCAQELDSRNDPRSPLGERVHGPLL